MAALRKMLGDLADPSVVALMRLIETQSKMTLAAWAANEARVTLLPLLAKTGSSDLRPSAAIDGVEACLAGTLPLKELKPLLADARKAGQELNDNPVQQAAARAVGTAAAVLTTPTNALGYTFYLCAAVAYDRLGLDAPQADYDAAASREGRLLADLQACAIPDEPSPAKVNWGC